MRVNIYETIEISDEQRVKLGAILSGSAKPKKQATRDEIKQYAWSQGSDWDSVLEADYKATFEAPTEPESDDADDDDEDLLGVGDDADDDDEDLI